MAIEITATIILVCKILLPNFTNALLDIINLEEILDFSTLVSRASDSSYVFLGWECWRVIHTWDQLHTFSLPEKLYQYPVPEFTLNKLQEGEKFLHLNKSKYNITAIQNIMKQFPPPNIHFTDSQLTNYCYECVRLSLPPFLLVYSNRTIIDLHDLCYDFESPYVISLTRDFKSKINCLIDVRDIIATMKYLVRN